MTEEAKPGEARVCLVISPIGDELAAFGTPENQVWADNIQLWEKVFQPVCDSVGLRVIRADKISESGDIPEQIFTLLRDADVVIADVSGGNANVMYELGVRHTRDLLTIQVGEHAKLPFDITTIRTIQFKRTAAGFVDLRARLLETLTRGLDGDYSPVRVTQLWTETTSLDPEALQAALSQSEQSDDDGGDVDEPGFLDILAEAESSLHAVNGVVNSVGDNLSLIGTIMQDGQARIQESDLAKKGFAGRILVARDIARDISEPVSEMETLADDFATHMESVSALIDFAIMRAEEDPEQGQDAEEFFDQVVTLADSAEASTEGMMAITQGARDMQKIAKDLQDPGKQLERAMGRFMNGIDTVISWRADIEAYRDRVSAN
jgi:hypothetical protein